MKENTVSSGHTELFQSYQKLQQQLPKLKAFELGRSRYTQLQQSVLQATANNYPQRLSPRSDHAPHLVQGKKSNKNSLSITIPTGILQSNIEIVKAFSYSSTLHEQGILFHA